MSGDSHLSNPPVGLVTPETDPDAGQKKKTYAYDPHLDPQLVWAGKAEHTSFEVPTVSLHVTLKSIANNPEIDGIHARWQAWLEPIRAQLNTLLAQTWEEWQIPREPGMDWPEEARRLLAEWWDLRRKRQAEIDAAIARHAPQETLYDQPLIDRKKLCVSGPFTVEAVPAPAVKSVDEILEQQPQPADSSIARSGETLRQGEWRDELLRTGIRGKAGQYIRFSRLEPLPGCRWLHADGETRPSTEGADSLREDARKYVVEVHGFDYYNTKTGGIESGGEDKIAVWMLDTDYDGRSLYPRQVFFPMAGEKEGWARLARNLKAEIDEERIEAYRGTVSLPFEPGEHKRIAVKIVDDRGIESLKVLEVE